MEPTITHSFERDLRVPHRPLIAGLLVPAIILSFFMWEVPNTSGLEDLILLMYAVVLVAWLLDTLHPAAGRWSVVAAVALTVCLTQEWLRSPEIYSLLAVPAVLSLALIGIAASFFTATLLSVFLVVLWRLPSVGLDTTAMVSALAVIWGTVITVSSIHRPARRLARWSWQHYERARELLEEARDRQAELADALDALAHANRELALTSDRLAALRVIAEQAQKAKAAFVANVSHEFRTPLNIIIGLAEILLDAEEVYGEQIPPNARGDLAILYRNSEHLATMVNDVLDLSQVEAGRLPLHREYVDPMSLVDSALTVVRPLVENRNLALQVEVPPDLPPVYCDPTRIRQVVLNLISNAARFTESGGITVRLEVSDSYLITCVSDTGPGIAPQELKRIFEPFWQAPRRPGQLTTGSGLGLAISQQFVELHEGEMWVESQVGEGSSFYFKLPISPLSGPVMAPHGWITEGWTPRTARGPLPVAHLDERVIVCDQAGGLATLLGRYDDHVEFVETQDLEGVARSFEEGAAQAVVLNAEPDQLWPLIDEARQQLPDTPLIGCSVPPRLGPAIASGASGCIIKPVTRKELTEALEALPQWPRQVLVVDDDEDTLWVMSRMLTAIDDELQVLTAATGAEGLGLMRTRSPELVFLDIILPDMSGWDILEARNHEPGLANMPITILSAQDLVPEPLRSRFVVATMGQGLSISRLLGCSRVLSALLLRPDQVPDPGPL